MRVIAGLFLLFLTYAATSFEQNITDDDRKLIQENRSVVFGVFPKDLKEKLENYGFSIIKASVDKNKEYYIHASLDSAKTLWVNFNDCEIEHTPTYCASTQLLILVNPTINKEKQQELLTTFWRYRALNLGENIIFSSFIDFSDVSEAYIDFRIEELMRLMEELSL